MSLRFAAPGPLIRTSSPLIPTILPPLTGVKTTSIQGRELAERWLRVAPANGLVSVAEATGAASWSSATPNGAIVAKET